jgi:hypothetical protein
MALETFNVVGDRLRVDELIRRFDIRVQDKFPSPNGNTNFKDINVLVDDEIADDFTDFCESNDLACDLV